LTTNDLKAALAAGWRDFLAYPVQGFFFGAIYVLGGWFILAGLSVRGAGGWLITAAAGFPLLAPFAAVGLYEISRCREAGLPVRWGKILGALRGRGDDQLLLFGGVIFVAFSFWVIIAHGIFAIFGVEAIVSSGPMALIQAPAGLAMLLVGGLVGALMALAFFAVTVVSLPMLVDREVDFLTAIITSLRAMQANRNVLLLWAAVIALTLFLAMLPLFLGLFAALPVLGHATWHLYRRIIRSGDL
jgi:uncharacterized membrane protein